jgi:hypothetical protein
MLNRLKNLFISLLIIIFLGCFNDEISTPTPEPKGEEIQFQQILDNGKIYSSKDFFEAGFNQYKEYNVLKLTEATEAWYGYWGPDEDNVKYYELRFYPNHSTAVSEGKAFAEDDTGENAKLERKNTMWRTGLSDRKVNASCEYSHGKHGTGSSNCGKRLYKYGDYMIFNNVIILCEGENSKEAFPLCHNLINIISNQNIDDLKWLDDMKKKSYEESILTPKQ